MAKFILFITKKKERCIPCKRMINFAKEAGLKYVIKYAEDELDYFLWLTNGKTVVPILVNLENGKVMIGCPVDYSEFLREIKRLVSDK